MSLKLTPEHEKNYKELSTSVVVALPEMKGKDLVSNFVRLCAVEIKFLHGCSVPWPSMKRGKHSAPAEDGSVPASPTPPGSSEIQASQHAGALSSGEAESESEGNSTHADEKANTMRTARATIAVVIVRCISASSLIPRILWKSTGQASNILSQSTSSHVFVRCTQLPPCFNSTMSWLPSFLSLTTKSTKGGRHITSYQRYSATTKHR